MMLLFAKKHKRGSNQKNAEKNAHRLPKNAIATHYTVCFKPSLEDLSFEASVAIDIKLVENTKQIVLNAVDLVISKVMWEEDVTQNRQEPVEMQFMDRGQLCLHFEPFLVPQEGQLRLNFKGKINDKKMAGFYKSKCHVNENEYNLISQFEPSDARRCFPCFDDPSCKASFEVCVIAKKGQAVVGNMPQKVCYNHKRNPALDIIEFKATPPMPAYSLAFVMGSFEYIEGRTTDDEIAIRVYTPPEKKEQGKYALNVACRAVPFLATYFDCPYPMQKLDLMAVADFAATAVENWGLIMYQESHLLIDSENAASADEQSVAMIICEELVKQWFGNLVTISWWNQLWMKEGLASFLRYICMEELEPDFECSTHFVTEIVQKALRADGYRSTHAVEIPIHNSLETEELFDEICHKKGSALMRMLYNYIGEENFKSGLNKVLTKFRFKTATTDDFWKCFEETCNKPVQSLMNSWVTQRGFPLVKVMSKQDGKNRILKLTQEKFCVDPLGRDFRNDAAYMIPLTVTSEKDPKSAIFETIMDAKTTTIVIPDVGKSDWLKLNPGLVGFYRVRYPSDMIPMLVHAVRDKSLEPVDRLNLLDDQFALLMSGMGSTIEILTLMEAYVEEDDYNVWCTISYVFEKIFTVFSYLNFDHAVRHYGRFIFSRVLERVGYTFSLFDHHHLILLRVLVLTMMVKFHHPETMDRCKTWYDSFLAEEESIPANLKSVIYTAILSKSEEDTVKHFLRTYRESNSVEDKDRIAHSLGAVTDLSMIKYILEFAASEDVRKQDTVYIMLSIAKTRAGRDLCWNFFKDNFSIFKNRYGSSLGSKLVRGLTENFATDEKMLEVVEFFKTNSFPGTDRAVQQSVESIRANESWLKREKNIPALQDYLEADTL